MRRVVVTGMGLVSPLGHDLETVEAGLRASRTGVRLMPEWDAVDGMRTRVSAPVAAGLDPKVIPRKFRRAMGPQAVYAALAARAAVDHAGLDPATLANGRSGVACSSTMGSAERQYAYYDHIIGKQTVGGLKGTAFFTVMGHTCAANLAVYLGVTGRVMAPMSACTSASQSIGAGFEAIRYGMQDVMVCGGADEAHFTAAATFDTVGGTSCGFHDSPERTPRPFDLDRDGLVVGEGAGILVLEALEHARARGATPLAEVVGYATTCDGSHVSQPQRDGMVRSIQLALADAGVAAADVGYINAHATATPVGDPVEAAAMREVFGDGVPVSSTKGHTGHTLGACGAIESVFTILMMRGGFLAATRNLERVDPACDGLQHVPAVVDRQVAVALNNNFAFGGVNTSLVFSACG